MQPIHVLVLALIVTRLSRIPRECWVWTGKVSPLCYGLIQPDLLPKGLGLLCLSVPPCDPLDISRRELDYLVVKIVRVVGVRGVWRVVVILIVHWPVRRTLGTQEQISLQTTGWGCHT